MEKYGFVLAEVSKRSLHHIARAGETRLCMPDGATTLSPLRLQPLVKQIEIPAAVINLAVVISRRLPPSDNRHVLRPSVAHAGHVLSEMDGRVGIVSHPKQQYLPIELMDAADWAAQTVRYILGMRRRDFRGSWAGRGERVRVVAAPEALRSPECIRYHAHSDARSLFWVEGVIAIFSHARHDQSTRGTQSGQERLDQASRPTFDRPHLRERRVD